VGVSDAQASLALIAAIALALAVFAGWRAHRRGRRRDPDAVGWVDWTLVQMVALIALAVTGYVALKG
jgi:small-conductance mechanosensitive channel